MSVAVSQGGQEPPQPDCEARRRTSEAGPLAQKGKSSQIHGVGGDNV